MAGPIMSERLHAALAALPPRQLNLLCIGMVAIAAMLAWTVGLRGPLAAYRQQRTALTALEASAAVMAGARTGPAPAGAAAAGPDQAAAIPAVAPVAPVPLALVAAISRSARLAGVQVSSAAQGAERTVAGLRQQVVDITASGGYGDICAWLDDIERSQPGVGIVQLALHPGDTGGRRKVTLQLAIYATPAP
jgi:type II secretory pathway component PulM